MSGNRDSVLTLLTDGADFTRTQADGHERLHCGGAEVGDFYLATAAAVNA